MAWVYGIQPDEPEATASMPMLLKIALREKEWQDKIVFATQEDIPKWMELVFLIGTAYDKSNIFFLA